MGLQYGIKEVMDINLLDFKTKQPIVFIDYATATSNENTGERLDLTGGRGNAKQMSFDHSKASTFTLNVPLVDLNLLSILTGDDIGSGVGEIFKREVLTVTGSAGSEKITLAQTPISGSVSVYKLEGLRDNGTPVTVDNVTGKDVDLSGAVAGDEVVAFYQYAAPASSKRVSVKSTKFPKAVEIFGTGLARNQEDEQDYPCHVHVFKARPQNNFTFTMSGTEATNLELTFDLYEVKDANGEGQYIDYIFETE